MTQDTLMASSISQLAEAAVQAANSIGVASEAPSIEETVVSAAMDSAQATAAVTESTSEVPAMAPAQTSETPAPAKKPRAKKQPEILLSPTRKQTAEVSERDADFVFLGEPMLALDTESTGIGHKWHRLLEVAAVEFDSATGLPSGRTYYTQLNPQQEVDEQATAVHGKTWEMLKEEPVFADIADSFLAFIKNAKIVIHNKPFDAGFLDEELKRVKKNAIGKVADSVECTLEQSREYVRAKRHTLDALCDRYSVDRAKRTLHGALCDCELLAAVYPHLMKEVNALKAKLFSALPFSPDDMPEGELDMLVEQELQLASVIKLLENVRKRRTNAIKQLVEGRDVVGEFYEVAFSNRTTTDWDAIMQEHLPTLDLAPYQKAGSAMKVRYL